MTEPPASIARRFAAASRALQGIVALIHPFPAMMNASVAAIFYALASREWATTGVVRIFLSVLLVHAAIGSLNDRCDIDLDRHSRPEKPLVAGWIAPRTALVVTVASAVLGLLLSASFGGGALAIALLVLVAGVAYDFWMKGTVLSWLPYAIAIPALPVWSFVAAGNPAAILLLAFPLGALLALGLNLANTLPDLAGDRAQGVRGLAHRLGERRALWATWSAFAATIVLIGVSSTVAGNHPQSLIPGLAVATLVLGAMVLDRRFDPSQASLRRGWYLSAILAAVLGLAWVVSLPAR